MGARFRVGEKGSGGRRGPFYRGLACHKHEGALLALIACLINGFSHFSFKIKTSVSSVKPLLDCLHHSGLQWVGYARHGSDGLDGMQVWNRSHAQDGARAWSVGTARTMNRALGPCPPGPGLAGQHGSQRIRPMPGKRENKTLQKLIRTER
jgi:hypothetical protein